MIGIYKITSPTNKIYIGQSTDIKLRFHYYSKLRCKNQPRLYNSFLKHGVDNHLFEVLEECCLDMLNKRERHYQDLYDVIGKLGLNCLLTTTETKTGYHSKTSLAKMGESQKKIWSCDKYKKKMSEAHKGYKHTNEQKKKISESLKGLVRDKSIGEKISKSKKGKLTGEESFRARIVLDLQTGIYYHSTVEASTAYNIKNNTLIGYLLGRYKNKTSLIYV